MNYMGLIGRHMARAYSGEKLPPVTRCIVNGCHGRSMWTLGFGRGFSNKFLRCDHDVDVEDNVSTFTVPEPMIGAVHVMGP